MSDIFYFTAGYDVGWFLASDILLKLPLVIFCNVIYIPYRVRQLFGSIYTCIKVN